MVLEIETLRQGRGLTFLAGPKGLGGAVQGGGGARDLDRLFRKGSTLRMLTGKERP